MQKFLTFIGFFALTIPSIGQGNFSFNCRKDTTIECTTSCITLKTVLPDIHSSTASYTVNQLSALSCFRPYVSPLSIGTLANLLIDDRYSPPIDITFPFSFYGNTYTKLIASTNGFLSFDITKATAFSHFGILKSGVTLSSTSGVPEDIPSKLYDKALIMGPYHDLDPNISTSTQQIKYDVIGTAPYRKWILSYYNVPLYTTACLNLNYNTHQIVLYETLGIVEIFIYNKEICLNWNDGRAMIGLQDFNKTSAIMAPGRRASDAPWGSKGMNESWRFVPASGQSLFRKTELYTLSGNFVATGKTISSANNLLDVSFDNVCPPSTGETYLVKSFYKDPGNLSSEIIGIDTINISRGDPIRVNITPANCIQNSKGQIDITAPIGPYEYSIDGINWQTSTVFTVPPATYTLSSRIIGSKCISTKPIYITTESFEAFIKIILKPCPPPLSASIQIFPVHGTLPYLYSLNGGALQTSNTFTGLLEGNYTIRVQDAKGCTYTKDISVVNENLASASVTNSICGKAPSGSISVTPNFGFSPYNYSINGGQLQSSNVFNNLAPGMYNITIQDSTLCNYSLTATVNSDVVMYANPVLVRPACFGNSNGKITIHAFAGDAPYKYAIDSDTYKSDSTFNNLSAGKYILHIKDSSGCILDTTVMLEQPNPVGGSNVIIPATNCFSNDGQITVKANGGNVPYMYSIDNGASFQVSNIFTAKAGIFNIIIKDSTGCSAKTSDTLPAADNKLLVDLGPDKTICAGSSVTLSVHSTQPVAIYNLNPSAGLSLVTSHTIIASPSDTTTYIILAKTDVCQGYDTITVNVLHKPIADAGIDTIICNNSYAILHGSAKNISGGVNYLWSSSPDILTPNSQVTIVHPKYIRPNKYTLEVSDNYGCNFKSYDDVIVTMRPIFVPFAGNDTIASIGIPHQLHASDGGMEYVWSPASVLNNPSLQNPTAVLQNDVKFNLIVKDFMGCIGTSSVLVKVYKGVTFYIPNAFTPNGDGINDTFKAIAPGIQTNYFRIYNRWGKLIFESHNANNGWDGKYLGMPQPTAVYVWIIKGVDVTGKIISLRGTVTLIR